MKYYVLYETDRMEHADEYQDELYAKEYAQEAVDEGYLNVRVLSEKEFIAQGYKEKFKMS